MLKDRKADCVLTIKCKGEAVMNEYSKRIKDYMDYTGQTVESLAEQTGIPASRIEEIVLKDKLPEISELMAIAELKEISMDYFLGRIKIPLYVPRTKAQAKVNHIIMELSEEELNEMIKVAREIGMMERDE